MSVRQLRACTVLALEPRIVEIVWEEGVTVSLADLEAIVAFRREVANGAPHCILSNLAQKGIAPEARRYAGSPAYAAGVTGGAMYGSFIVGRLLANTFMRMERPPFPTRLFAERDEALLGVQRMGGGDVGRATTSEVAW